MVVKTFRALLADGGQDHIRLQTIKGKVGYRITKFQLMSRRAGDWKQESQVKIYKTSQTTIDEIVDFTDSDLLAAAYLENNDSANYIGVPFMVIFDNEIFNQDIFITHDDASGDARPVNYYFELEVIPLDEKSAEYTTVKDLRTRGF